MPKLAIVCYNDKGTIIANFMGKDAEVRDHNVYLDGNLIIQGMAYYDSFSYELADGPFVGFDMYTIVIII